MKVEQVVPDKKKTVSHSSMPSLAQGNTAGAEDGLSRSSGDGFHGKHPLHEGCRSVGPRGGGRGGGAEEAEGGLVCSSMERA